MNLHDRMYEKIRKVFNDVENCYERSALQDLFALGCHLHGTGRTSAGLKTCATALRGAHCGDEVERSIIKYVPGHERECFEAAWAHAELKGLIPESAPELALV